MFIVFQSAIVMPKEQRLKFVTRKLENACARKGSVAGVVTVMRRGGGATLSSRAVAAMRRALPPPTAMLLVSVPACSGSLVGRAVSAVQATSVSLTVSPATVTRLAALEYLATTRVNASAKTTTAGLTVTSAVKGFTTFLFVKVIIYQATNMF